MSIILLEGDACQLFRSMWRSQRNKSENIMTPGFLQPLNIPNQKWEEIPMDFIEGFPVSEGKDKIS